MVMRTSQPKPDASGKAGRPGAYADEPLPRERLPGSDARAEPDQLPPDALGDPEAAPDSSAERRHREVGFAPGEREQ